MSRITHEEDAKTYLTVEGVGVVSKEILQDHVTRMLEDIVTLAREGAWNEVAWRLGVVPSSSLLPVYITELKKVEDQNNP